MRFLRPFARAACPRSRARWMSTGCPSIDCKRASGSRCCCRTVKQGMPIVLMGQPTEACKRQACMIQTCLAENNYNPRACAWAVDGLRKCCENVGAHSLHCSFPPERPPQQQREPSLPSSPQHQLEAETRETTAMAALPETGQLAAGAAPEAAAAMEPSPGAA